MKISELMAGLTTEQVDEGVFGSIGRAAEKAIGGTAKAVGYMAGVPGAMGTMYQQGKARAQAGITGQLPQPTRGSTVNPEYQRYLQNYRNYGSAEPPTVQQSSQQTQASSPDDMDNYASELEKNARSIRTQADTLRQQLRTASQRPAITQQTAPQQAPTQQTAGTATQQSTQPTSSVAAPKPSYASPGATATPKLGTMSTTGVTPRQAASRLPAGSLTVPPAIRGSATQLARAGSAPGASTLPKNPAPGASSNPSSTASQEEELKDFGNMEEDFELAEMMRLVKNLKR